MARPGGNPNIRNIRKTGPTTEIGKLKNAVSSTKYPIGHPKRKQIDRYGDGHITKIMKESGVDFSIPEKALADRNLFEIWLQSYKKKNLTEIQQMDKILQLLDMDMTGRVMEKLTQGIPLEKRDMDLIRLLKECLAENHKMKYGETKVNIHGDFDDIRKMMFIDP